MEVEKFKFEKFKDIVLSNITDKKLLFHCSATAGLTELKPHPSYAYKKGSEPCIYASYHLNSILFYGSKKHKGGLDGDYGLCDEKGTVFFNEMYEDSLKKVYKGEKCYIYIVDQEQSSFKEGQTSYSAEVVDGTGNNVKLLKCYEVDDIYELILKFVECGFIKIKLYNKLNADEYEKIKDKQKWFIKFYSSNKDGIYYKFCEEHFPEAFNELVNEQKIF